ncbi:MAG: YIP1 family protein [Deltaproteobacteria bacterium]|nr:YIP1 family protein [Deltaproteobacteria bacterium]
MNTFQDRLTRAARLDKNVYEEVERDRDAFGQALGVVLLASVAAGIGGLGRGAGFQGLVAGTVSALVGWFVWAYIVYLVGTRFLPEPQTRTDYAEVLRTTGFAAAPGLVRAFGLIPGLSRLAFLVAAVWMIATMVIAVRQALDYETTLRAVLVCVIGWVLQSLLVALLAVILGGPGPL